MRENSTIKQNNLARVWTLEDLEGWRPGVMATVGMFDGVHSGHRHIVSDLMVESQHRGLRPVVVTFANHPRLALGKVDSRFRLLSTREERFAMLSALGVSDVVEVAFTQRMAHQSACEFLEQTLHGLLGVEALLLGYDNMFGSKQRDDFHRLPEVASRLAVSLLHDTALSCEGVAVSSSQVRSALAEGDIARANRMLGYTYHVSGEVVHGRHVGRTLGFPTANVDMTGSLKALPADGVYAVEVLLQGRHYRGMANVGTQPTFGLSEPTLEVNLFDFDADIYGETLTVSFERRLRAVKQFASLTELITQLEADREEARL